MPINIMRPAELFDRMKARCQLASGDRPPFTLIIGSGFSYPIIPTTAHIVREDLPWWKWCQRNEKEGPSSKHYVERNETGFSQRARGEARAFWGRVSAAVRAVHAPDKIPFALDPEGLPTQETVGEAYRFALSAQCGPGLNSPHDVRRYFGDLIRRIGRRLNPAHLFLAAVIAEHRRLFGTIFTTNFDPLLQRALQLVNVPYFVSDRPETMQHPDDDDVADALHLVHAHGSIYRYLLVNSPEEIEAYANRNQSLLQEYFRKHAVLIVGFSGWDDAVTRALKSVDRFAHNLYWCDRGGGPDTSGLTADAKSILAKHNNAFYVPITGADGLMAQMHQHLLGSALPRMFRDPILTMKGQLELCDMNGVKLPKDADPAATSQTFDAGQSPNYSMQEELDLGNSVRFIIGQLELAQGFFTDESGGEKTLRARIRQRYTTATSVYFGTRPLDALHDFDYVIKHASLLEPAERAGALRRRGYLYGLRGGTDDIKREIADYTAVINMSELPAEERAMALINRGYAYGMRGGTKDPDREIADYTKVLNLPGASADVRAEAQVNRAIAYGERSATGFDAREIKDYTAVIKMADAPKEQMAKALLNRGLAYGRRAHAHDTDREIADYTAVIELSGAPAEFSAQARVNRGVAYGERGQQDDFGREIDDFSFVINMPDSPADQRAQAHLNRASAYERRGEAKDVARKIADYTAVLAMSDAPSELHVAAMENLNLLRAKKKR